MAARKDTSKSADAEVAEGDRYDPVAHLLQEQVDAAKADLEAAEKRLADHTG